MKIVRSLGALVVAAMAGAASASLVAQGATATAPGTIVCSANPCAVQMPNNGSTGLQIMDSTGPRVDNPFIVVDHNDAPMWWTNVGGSYSGDTQICITGRSVFVNEICMQPNGSITMRGRTGATRTLWPGDIVWLHTQRYGRRK